MRGLISDLQTLIRQPSISAKKQGLNECASLVSRIMVKAGIKSEVWNLGRYEGNQKKEATAPIVYGEVRSKENPNAKTILFYHHYDVQPEEPVEFWTLTHLVARWTVIISTGGVQQMIKVS